MARVATPLAALLLVLTGLVAGCADSQPQSRGAPAKAPAPDPVSLSLLVFNVEYGGSKATDAVMADVDADVVSVLESYNRLPEIAKKAGYPYYDVGLQILSKYPILEPSQADGRYAWIEVRPGEAVALVNTHLDYVHDGPNRLLRGVPATSVLATEKAVRLSSIDKLLPSATSLLEGRLAGAAHRRPQRALPPRLDGTDRRSARRCRRPGLAGERGRHRSGAT